MEEITITKEELQRIIAQEVFKKVKESDNQYSVNFLFSDLMIRSEDIQQVNSKFESVCDVLSDEFRYSRGYDPYPSSILSINDYYTGPKKIKSKASFSDVHDFCRKLSLAVFGKTLNSQLSKSEYELSRKFYDDFKELFLKSYEERLNIVSSELH